MDNVDFKMEIIVPVVEMKKPKNVQLAKLYVTAVKCVKNIIDSYIRNFAKN